MAQKPTLPHSWAVTDWPADIFPNDPKKARHMVRSNKDEMVRKGVLVRVGRSLVVIGAPYAKWIAQQGAKVPGYECPANRPRAEA